MYVWLLGFENNMICFYLGNTVSRWEQEVNHFVCILNGGPHIGIERERGCRCKDCYLCLIVRTWCHDSVASTRRIHVDTCIPAIINTIYWLMVVGNSTPVGNSATTWLRQLAPLPLELMIVLINSLLKLKAKQWNRFDSHSMNRWWAVATTFYLTTSTAN